LIGVVSTEIHSFTVLRLKTEETQTIGLPKACRFLA